MDRDHEHNGCRDCAEAGRNGTMNLNLTDEEMAVIIRRLDKAIDITETKGLPEPLYWLCLARHGGQMTRIEDEGRKTK